MSAICDKSGCVEVILTIILLTLSWTAVSVRLWVRVRITRSPSWDDVFLVATLFLFTAYSGFILVPTTHGQYSFELVQEYALYVQLGEIFYIITTTFLKIALGLLFLRVLTKPWQKRIFHIILVVSVIMGVYYMFIALFQCGNPAKFKENLFVERQCLPTMFLFFSGYLYGGVNVLAEWTFVLIPISTLMESHVDRRTKLSVSIIMGLGAIGSVSGIMRMVYLDGLLFTEASTNDAYHATIWATAEAGTSIIAASLATFRPLFVRVLERFFPIVSPNRNSHIPRGTIRIHREIIVLRPMEYESLEQLTYTDSKESNVSHMDWK